MQKRKYYSDSGSITELDLIRIKKEGQIADELLQKLNPYFDKLRQIIHDKWEMASLADEETLKQLKYKLRALTELQQLMSLEVTHGKQAANKLEKR